MEVILHVGVEKTGTTSIQKFLYLNRDLLLEKGILFPTSIGIPNNRLLTLACYKGLKSEPYLGVNGINSEGDLAVFQQKTWEALKNEMASHGNLKKVVISSEHIHSRLKDDEELEKLKSGLKAIGVDDITVIIYLRNPSQLANSMYSTAIKSGNNLNGVPPPTRGNFNRNCNHKATLQQFSRVFQKENLRVRLFRKDKFLNGSLIEDFISVSGLPIYALQGAKQPQVENESLSPLGIQLLKCLNESAQLKPAIRHHLYRLITSKLVSPKFVMSKKRQKEYYTFFEESNEWVRQHFFPTESTLFEKQIKSPNIKTANKEEVKILFNLLVEQVRELEKA